jgi:hypothetical protein
VREDGVVPVRRLLLLVTAVGVVLVVAVGATYPTVGGARCPERVWSAALDGLADRTPDPCAAQSLDKVYAVAAGVLGLVLVSTLLTRRR